MCVFVLVNKMLKCFFVQCQTRVVPPESVAGKNNRGERKGRRVLSYKMFFSAFSARAAVIL